MVLGMSSAFIPMVVNSQVLSHTHFQLVSHNFQHRYVNVRFVSSEYRRQCSDAVMTTTGDKFLSETDYTSDTLSQ